MDRSLFSDEFLKKLDKLVFISKKIPKSSLQGVQRTYKKGSSLEFNDYRSYNSGDDIRGIDWNVWERLGQLYLKLYSAHLDRTISIIIDTSKSMSTGRFSKLTFAKKTAAALGYIGLKNQDRVGVFAINKTIIDYMKPVGGNNQVISLFNFLSTLEASGKTDLSAVLKSYSTRSQKNSIAIIISDFLDNKGFKEGLYNLLYKKLDVIVLHILSDEDLNPDFSGPVRLKDIETGDTLDLTFNNEVLGSYRKSSSLYFKKIEKFCLEKRIEYIRISSSTPFEDLILKYMRQSSGILLGGIN